MGVTQILAKREPVLTLLNGEGKKAAGRERSRDGGKDGREITEIDEHIGRQHEIGFGASEIIKKPQRLQIVIDGFRLGTGDHGRREIATAKP